LFSSTLYNANLHLFLNCAKFMLFLPRIKYSMLQRIQTIWTFLAVLAAVFLFLTGQDVAVFGTIPVIDSACIALVLVGLLSVLSFKNRKRQILLNTVSIIINALLIGVLIYWLLNLSGGIQFPEKGIEPVFPLIAIICLFISNIYIRKDERLVKSVDRLR
jgi:O-antigen ligase